MHKKMCSQVIFNFLASKLLNNCKNLPCILTLSVMVLSFAMILDILSTNDKFASYSQFMLAF